MDIGDLTDKFDDMKPTDFVEYLIENPNDVTAKEYLNFSRFEFREAVYLQADMRGFRLDCELIPQPYDAHQL